MPLQLFKPARSVRTESANVNPSFTKATDAELESEGLASPDSRDWLDYLSGLGDVAADVISAVKSRDRDPAPATARAAVPGETDLTKYLLIGGAALAGIMVLAFALKK